MASTADKQAAVNKAASQGLGALDKSERSVFDDAAKSSMDFGRTARNIAAGKDANASENKII